MTRGCPKQAVRRPPILHRTVTLQRFVVDQSHDFLCHIAAAHRLHFSLLLRPATRTSIERSPVAEPSAQKTLKASILPDSNRSKFSTPTMTKGSPRMDHDEETIRQLYDRFNARDIEAVFSLLTDDVAWANGMDGTHVQ